MLGLLSTLALLQCVEYSISVTSLALGSFLRVFVLAYLGTALISCLIKLGLIQETILRIFQKIPTCPLHISPMYFQKMTPPECRSGTGRFILRMVAV